MKLKNLFVMMMTVAVLLGSFAAATPAADRTPKLRRHHAAQSLNNPALKLTPEQKQQMLANRYQFQKETLDMRFALKKKKMELRRLWQATVMDQKTIESKTQEVTALRVQLAVKRQALRANNQHLLTPEQQKILATGVRKRKGRPNKGKIWLDKKKV
jgi:Spy/CpxP family protein refolding chaperone